MRYCSIYENLHSRSNASLSLGVIRIRVFFNEGQVVDPQVDTERDGLQASSVNLVKKNKVCFYAPVYWPYIVSQLINNVMCEKNNGRHSSWSVFDETKKKSRHTKLENPRKPKNVKNKRNIYLFGNLYIAVLFLNICILLPVAIAVGIT